MLLKKYRRNFIALKKDGSFECVVKYTDGGMQRALVKRLGNSAWISSVDKFFVSNVIVSDDFYVQLASTGDVDDDQIKSYRYWFDMEGLKTMAARTGRNIELPVDRCEGQVDEDGNPCQEYVPSKDDLQGYA